MSILISVPHVSTRSMTGAGWSVSSAMRLVFATVTMQKCLDLVPVSWFNGLDRQRQIAMARVKE